MSRTPWQTCLALEAGGGIGGGSMKADARRTKSVEALLGEGGLETAQRFVNIEDDCLRASSAVIGGTASPARSTTTPSKRVRFEERRRHGA